VSGAPGPKLKLDLVDNPFFVLELEADAGPMEAERSGNKLLAELDLGRASAGTYLTPFGPRVRDAELVRKAMAALREPRLREVYASFAPPRSTWRTDARTADGDPARTPAEAALARVWDAIPSGAPSARRLLIGPRAPATPTKRAGSG
jgi:hypothetical protein